VIRRKVAVVLTTRGNYGKMLSTMRAVRAHPALELQVILGGGILRDTFGRFAPVLAADGFKVDREVDYLVGDSGDLDSMTASAGRAVGGFGEALAALAPDIAVAIADRYEALSLALAATCRAVPIAHLEGGEVSGSIDDRIRHSISKLAQVHLPANRDAADRLLALGEAPDSIHVVGSPSIDIIAGLNVHDTAPLDEHQHKAGTGAVIDHRAPFLLVSQHPVVGEHEDGGRQTAITAAAVNDVGLPVIWILPNMDAGSAEVRQTVQGLQSTIGALRIYPSLPLPLYARAMAAAACLVGNTSSGIREAAFLGVPTVNIGSRQTGRKRGANVVDAGWNRIEIAAAIRERIACGRLPPEHIYGDGHAGEKIAALLASTGLGLEKRPPGQAA
jgi:UDP-hydrolysing UDP-N-acetyl-D-glucosamine 2-epimerase